MFNQHGRKGLVSDRSGKPNRSDDVRKGVADQSKVGDGNCKHPATSDPQRRVMKWAPVRSGVRMAAVASSIAKYDDEVKGHMDAVRELIEEKKLDYDTKDDWPVDGNDNPVGGPPPPPPPPAPPLGSLSPPVPRKVTNINRDELPFIVPLLNPGKQAKVETVKREWKYEDYVNAHFAAYGHSEKTWQSARTNVMRWLNVSNSLMDFGEAVGILDTVYSSHKWWLSWYHKIRAWWNNPLTQIKAIKFGAIMGVGVSAVLGFYARRHVKTACVAGLMGVGLWTYAQSMKPSYRKQRNVGDFCTGQQLPTWDVIDTGAVIKDCDVIKSKCVGRQFPVGFSFAIDSVWVPRSCYHNECNALVTRQLQMRVPFTSEGEVALDKAYELVESLFSMPNLYPVYVQQWLEFFLSKYSGTRKAQILASMRNNIVVNTQVAGFPKIETSVGKEVEKRKVRFVSGFADGYLAETGPEYYMFQKVLCKTYWGRLEDKIYSKLVYTGGFHALEVGAWFQAQVDRQLVLLLLDMSKFDSRNKKELMTKLYLFYKKRLSEELFNHLLATFNKIGRTKCGYSFSVEATVASGRIDTSFGNTILIFMIVLAILYLLDRAYFDEFISISALGDDNNSALVKFDHKIEDIRAASRHVGHEADGTIIRPGQYHLLEYCSQRLWEYQHGKRVLGHKIGRLLAKTFVCHRHVPADKLEAHIAGVLYGCRYYAWLPVFGVVYRTWFARHPDVTPKRYYQDDETHKCTLKEEIEVDDALVRSQFAAVYGFDAVLLEEWIETLPFELGDTYTHPLMDRIMSTDSVSYSYGVKDWVEYFRQSCFR